MLIYAESGVKVDDESDQVGRQNLLFESDAQAAEQSSRHEENETIIIMAVQILFRQENKLSVKIV